MSDTSTCGCGKPASSCGSNTPATTSGDSSSKASSSATGIQNGKGDGPRNLSPRFRRNYDDINWESGGKKTKKTERFFKVYA